MRIMGVPVPLLGLGAHDLVVLRQHPERDFRASEEQFHSRTLLNIVQGNPPIHCFQAWEFTSRKADIAAFHKVLGRIHRQVGSAKMVDHQFLPGPGLYDAGRFFVQQSTFSDGTQIYVNLGLDPYRDQNVRLPAYGFEARLAGGEVLKGSVESRLQLTP